MDVRELLDRHLLVAIERQLVFGDLLGEGSYAVDLQTGRARIGDELELRVGLLGSCR